MASPVLQTYSVNNASTNTVNVTKPTGLSVGDLLLALVGGTADSGSPAIDTPSGWTKSADNSNNSVCSAILWKIADSSDAAASNFTFSHSGGGSSFAIYAVLSRITGHSSTAPISGAQCTHNTTTFNVSPQVTDALLLLGGAKKVSGGSGWSGYTISGSNPTWTEIADNGGGLYMGVAWAVGNSTATITSADAVESGSNDRQRFLVAVAATTDASVTLDVVPIASTVNDLGLRSDNAVTLDAIALTASVQNPTVTTPTSDTTNTTKNAGANIINTSKS